MLLNVGAVGLVTTFRPILAALNYKSQIGAAVIDHTLDLLQQTTKLQQSFQILLELQPALLIGFE